MATTKEIYTLTAAPIANSLFSSKWSEDDQISLVTEVGVHIFELVPIPQCQKRILQLNRSYLYPSDNIPALKYSDELNENIVNWDREQIYSLILESSITPRPIRGNPILPRIIDVAWSPKNLVRPNRCMLATLTSVGAVDIAVKNNRQWFSIYDLSSLWSRQLDEISTDTDSYAMYVVNARRLLATSLAWSSLQSENYAFLAVAYRSADLVIWKIPQLNDNQDGHIAEAQIVCKIELTHDIRARVMQWVDVSEESYELFVGYHDGLVQSFHLKLEGSVLLHTATNEFLESDRIPVTSISQLKKEGLEIVITKGKFLVYLSIDQDYSLHKCLFYRNPGLQISGISVISSNEILTVSEDGKLTLITMSNSEIQGRSVKNDMTNTKLKNVGLAGSKNRCLFATIFSPNSTYDHLVQREPTSINFFFIDDEKWDPFSILFQENVGNHLGDFWDCLEIIRIKIIDDQKYAESLFTRNDLENMTLGFLRTTLWINQIKQNCYRETTRLYNCNEARSLIFLHSAVNIILRLTEKKMKTKEEKTFMGLLKEYLEVYAGINDHDTFVAKTIQQALLKLQYLTPMAEVCGLCESSVCDSSSMTSICESGHKLPRCALTQMQITTIKFRVCPICKIMFHMVVDHIWDIPKCLYCDVALVYDSRISGFKFGESVSNLSRPSALFRAAGNGIDDEETEI